MMEPENAVTDLLRQAAYENDDLVDDDVAMADAPSHHADDDIPSDHTASTPSDADVDGASEAATSSKATTGPKKRKPGLDADGNPKPVKKRASQACEICRSRKVRCDSEKRHPCTNCADMGLNCQIPESKRRRRHLHATSTAHSILPNPGPMTTHPPAFTGHARVPSEDVALHVGDSPMASSCPVPQLYNTYRGGVASGQQSAWGSNEELEAWRALVPPFVKPPTPGRISREGLRYLQHMGALDIPDRALEKHLLLAYIEHVHPDFPIVELHAFLHQVSDRNGKRGQVSLLLYQCVMFAASAFVAPEHLAAAGFSNRRALRRVVFQAAKLLHDFDYENDKLVLLQATLLLSFWYEAPDDSKETWHWSGVAISQAQALGLHRGMLHPPRESNEECARRKLRRRIWWSCVMRDRQIGLGMSRLIRIKDEDFDVPMLEEGDFDIDVLADNTIISPEDCPMLYDVGMQQELAEMCVQKAKLYVLVGHVLQTVQSFQIATKNGSHSVASIIEGNLVTFDRVYRKLLAWASALPPSSHYRKLERQDIEHGRIPVAMQRTLLHMLYQTTVGKVYHPLIRPARGPQTTSGDEFPAVQGVSLEARQKCKGAAAEITRMVGELHELGLDRFFPTTGVTVIMPAMLMHLQEIASTEANVRETAHRGFETCMKVLYTLKETYAAAEYAAIFMDNVIKNKPGLERTASGTITASNRAQGPHPMVPLSQPFSGALLAPRTFATGITLSSSSMHAGGEHGHYKSTDTLSQQTSRQNLPIHHGLSDLGLANLSANSQPPTFSNLIAPFAQLPPEPRPQLPATTASPAALQTGSTTVDSWPIELVGMKQHDGGSSVSASASVSSPEEIASSFEDYTLVSGPSALGRDEHISAEGLSLSFPQLGDDLSWQNWLNLPPEQDPAAGHEDGWTSLSEQIEVVEPGVTIDVAPEGFVES